MKQLPKILIAPLSLGILFTSCSAPQASNHIDDGHVHDEQVQLKMVDPAITRQAVEDVLTQYSDQITAKDVAAMETYILAEGTDFTIFEGKGTNIGWADYRDHHLAPEFANEDLVFTKYEYGDYKISVSGTLASATFTIDMAYTYKGEDKTFIRHGTAILKNINGTWKIAHLHTS